MRSLAPLGVLGLIVFASSCADAATITGTVKGPDGAPFRAAFVQARHAGLKMTVSVLSDNQGKYIVENLPAGDYEIVAWHEKYGEQSAKIKVGDGEAKTQDFKFSKAAE